MEEQDAIMRLKQGDIAGLEALVRRYQVQAVRTAYLVTRDLPLAEDIVQGRAHEMDCIYKLRGQVRKLAYGMIELSKQIPLTSGLEDSLEQPDPKEVLPGAGK